VPEPIEHVSFTDKSTEIELKPGQILDFEYLLTGSFEFTINVDLGDAAEFTNYTIVGGQVIFKFAVPEGLIST
jgi:hypothetical protein